MKHIKIIMEKLKNIENNEIGAFMALKILYIR